MVRTGDTPQSARRRMVKHPPHILITTPESLYLILTSPVARDMFRTVRTVIVDEIHTLVGNKRGVHLAVSLERVEELAGQPIQRIGLSATQRPLEEVARFLGGYERANLPRHRATARSELLARIGAGNRLPPPRHHRRRRHGQTDGPQGHHRRAGFQRTARRQHLAGHHPPGAWI